MWRQQPEEFTVWPFAEAACRPRAHGRRSCPDGGGGRSARPRAAAPAAFRGCRHEASRAFCGSGRLVWADTALRSPGALPVLSAPVPTAKAEPRRHAGGLSPRTLQVCGRRGVTVQAGGRLVAGKARGQSSQDHLILPTAAAAPARPAESTFPAAASHRGRTL